MKKAPAPPFGPAQHLSDSSTSRFSSLSELNLDFLSSQQSELHIISQFGHAVRKKVRRRTQTHFLLLLAGDGLKIAIKVPDTDLY